MFPIFRAIVSFLIARGSKSEVDNQTMGVLFDSSMKWGTLRKTIHYRKYRKMTRPHNYAQNSTLCIIIDNVKI